MKPVTTGWRRLPLWVGVVALAAAAVACDGGGNDDAGPGSDHAAQASKRPGIVFVLTDDLSSDLVDYMPHVKAMQKAGTSFSNYTVTDSLCCPSRSSIFTGKYPHNTGVFTNMPPDGGFDTFHGRGNEGKTFATALQKQGYDTAMMGKYLNGYEPDVTVGGEKNYVPPGWNEWDVAGNGYKEYDYTLNENGKTVDYGKEPKDYLTDVVSGKGQDFIGNSVEKGKPFLLDISTFAPHGPATPAPQDENTFQDVKAPRPPAYDRTPEDAPEWLAEKKALTPKQQKKITMTYRKRVRAVQAVDRMVGDLQERLKKEGVYENTVFVFGSDNGFHTGQYRLMPGKQTAFDTDVNVPLVMTGPGIQKDAVSEAVASNIDLCPTFTDLGGGTPDPAADGRSLVPLLKGDPPGDWAQAALVEHHGPDTSATDPDKPRKDSGNPPSYEAVRTDRYTYVQYQNGTREYYDRSKDPDQLHNTYAKLSATTRKDLAATVDRLQTCKGAKECSAAARTD